MSQFTCQFYWKAFKFSLKNHPPEKIGYQIASQLDILSKFFLKFGPQHEKTCFRRMRATQAQTSAVWSAPLLFAFCKVPYVNLPQVKFQFSSWRDWLETRFVGHPKDRFSCDEAHLMFYWWGRIIVLSIDFLSLDKINIFKQKSGNTQVYKYLLFIHMKWKALKRITRFIQS